MIIIIILFVWLRRAAPQRPLLASRHWTRPRSRAMDWDHSKDSVIIHSPRVFPNLCTFLWNTKDILKNISGFFMIILSIQNKMVSFFRILSSEFHRNKKTIRVWNIFSLSLYLCFNTLFQTSHPSQKIRESHDSFIPPYSSLYYPEQWLKLCINSISCVYYFFRLIVCCVPQS